MPAAPSIVATDVSVAFGGVRALDSLTLTALPGQITALLGPNGAGKTTFIRCCTGLVVPDSGSILIDGFGPDDPRTAQRIGLMPQQTGAWSGIGAGQLLGYLARLYLHPQSVPELMALLGIDAFARTPYRRLSGGQQQAVNLAGALVGRPSVVFLDEPTAGLDVRARRSTWDLVRRVRDAGVGVLLTSHDMHEAAELADVVAILDGGRVTAAGTLTELTRDAPLEDVFLAHTSEGAA